MKKQAILIAALAVVVALMLGGCSDNKSGVKQTAEKDTKSTKNRQAKAPADPELQKLLDAINGKPAADSAAPGAPAIPGLTPTTPGTPAKPGTPARVAPGKRKQITPGMLKKLKTKPTGEMVLQVLQSAYLMAKQVRVEGTSSVSVKRDGVSGGGVTDAKSVMLFSRPNKFRMTGPGVTMCSDGSNVYLYDSRSQRYAKQPLDEKMLRSMVLNKGGVEVMGLLLGFDYSSIVSSVKLLPDAKIGGREAWVLSMEMKAVPGMPKGSTARQKLWIDKKDWGIYRSEISTRSTPRAPKGYTGKVPKLIETTTVAKISRFDLMAKLKDSDFKFTPPAGAKLMDLNNPREMARAARPGGPGGPGGGRQFEPPKPIELADKPAPDLEYTLDGSTRKLSDLRGKVVVLALWALPFSEKQLPVLQQFIKQKHEGVEIVAINLNTHRDKVEAFLKDNGFSFATCYADEKLAEAIAKGYGMLDGPTVYVIDKEGVVRRVVKGDPKLDDLNAKVQKVAAAG